MLLWLLPLFLWLLALQKRVGLSGDAQDTDDMADLITFSSLNAG
jgi:hypothetical protein